MTSPPLYLIVTNQNFHQPQNPLARLEIDQALRVTLPVDHFKIIDAGEIPSRQLVLNHSLIAR